MPPSELKAMRVDESRRDDRIGLLHRRFCLVAAPQMARAARHDRTQAAPIAADMRIVGLRNRLDVGYVEHVPAADMIFVTLGKDDLPDWLAADRAQAAMILCGAEA